MVLNCMKARGLVTLATEGLLSASAIAPIAGIARIRPSKVVGHHGYRRYCGSNALSAGLAKLPCSSRAYSNGCHFPVETYGAMAASSLPLNSNRPASNGVNVCSSSCSAHRG
jgi:hypothetical protein